MPSADQRALAFSYIVVSPYNFAYIMSVLLVGV